jgi:hypothetical protein
MRFLPLILLTTLSAHAADTPTFAGNWTCKGTVVTIDDGDVKTDCWVKSFQVSQDSKTFGWSGEIQCGDGTATNFSESDGVSGTTVLDRNGVAIGDLTNSNYSSSFKSGGLDYATTMKLSKLGLHFQHDQVSSGVPLLRWTFDCTHST